MSVGGDLCGFVYLNVLFCDLLLFVEDDSVKVLLVEFDEVFFVYLYEGVFMCFMIIMFLFLDVVCGFIVVGLVILLDVFEYVVMLMLFV